MKDDFICIHSDEGKEEAKKLMERVFAKLNSFGYEEPTTYENFLSRVVYMLEHNYEGYAIEGIACDMWAAVVVKKYGDDSSTIRVECDHIEHGVARAFELVTERVAPYIDGVVE